METVSTLASQTAAQSPSMDTFMEIFFSRLAAISFTHELLSSSGWISVPLAELIRGELVTLSSKGLQIRLEGPPLFLTASCALTLGIVFHELATDTVRYGAFSIGGEVAVNWSLAGDSSEQKLNLRWSETGGPQRGADPNRAFGFELIQRTIAVELQGTAEISFGESGLRCAISIPANHATLAATPLPAIPQAAS